MTDTLPAAFDPLGDRLAYVGVLAEDVEAWRRFATDVLGVHVDAAPDEGLRLRIDEKAVRFLVHPAPRNGFYLGWEVPRGATLDQAAARLAAANVAVERGTNNECALRHVEAMLWFVDPLGNRIELCTGHAAAGTDEPLAFSRPLAGFKTGTMGLGHAVLMGSDVDAARRFYLDVFGMRLSDYTEAPFDAHFYHVNSRHHSFAIIRNERHGLHHIMLELLELDDVGQTYDLLDKHGVRLGASLGRHTNDFMTSFYMFTPSQFMIEYGVGGREIDVAGWDAERLDCGPSFWGHERTWLPEPTRSQAFDMRLKAASDGLKAKLVVTPGRYVEASGETE